jgi:hypothetical protein
MRETSNDTDDDDSISKQTASAIKRFATVIFIETQ